MVGVDRFGGTLVYATMRQIKIETFVRLESDKRTYGDLFRKRTMSEWRDWIGARLASQVSENEFTGGEGPLTVRYQGLRGYFHDIVKHRDLIADWITANARLAGQISNEYDIGVDVRRGDFAPTTPGSSGSNTRLPLDPDRKRWLLPKPDWCRSAGSRFSPMVMPQRSRRRLIWARPLPIPAANALTAMLNLSKARMIIASRSTFSMWAAYLGGAPAIWDREFDLERYFPHRRDRDLRL